MNEHVLSIEIGRLDVLAVLPWLNRVPLSMVVARRRMRLPDFAGSLASGMDKLSQKAGFYHQKLHVFSELNKTIACSIAKARRELGYDPKIGLEEGMRRSIRWCLDNGRKI